MKELIVWVYVGDRELNVLSHLQATGDFKIIEAYYHDDYGNIIEVPLAELTLEERKTVAMKVEQEFVKLSMHGYFADEQERLYNDSMPDKFMGERQWYLDTFGRRH